MTNNSCLNTYLINFSDPLVLERNQVQAASSSFSFDDWHNTAPFTERYHSPTPPSSPHSVARSSLPSQELHILRAISRKDIDALNRASGIKEALDQMEMVERIRLAHDNGTLKNVEWSSIKNVITRRERVAKVLKEDFRGDQDAFTAYLQVEASTARTTKRKKPGDDGLLSFNVFVNEMLKACDYIIQAEKMKGMYLAYGNFSNYLWQQKWGDQNRFYIFRTLCLECIKAEKQKAMYFENNMFSEALWNQKWGGCKHWFDIYKKLTKQM